MSLTKSKELIDIAKQICRELRKRSTPAERILWERVRDRRLDGKKFYRQYPLFHDITGKETFFVADFFCFEEKLVIELDGEYHQYRLKEDEERTMILNYLGVRVVRFSNEEVERDVEGGLRRIREWYL